jgi:poly-gamma-glutamate capsule biosynthesis protein CapA/YwtB (metallophosphatase superfamily)
VQSGGGERRRRGARLATALVALVAAAGVVAGVTAVARSIQPAVRPTFGPGTPAPASTEPAATPSPTPAPQITLAFAGDVHFEGRVAERLATDPATAFGEAAAALSRADLTMVNLETAITEGGAAEPKQFTFRAPATAFTALEAAGIDVASMANNHGADFGATGLADTFDAIAASRFPTVGIGPDARRAYAPHYRDVRGHRVALLGASQIRDRTLAAWTAGADDPGIASAYSDRLVGAVRDARRRAEIVVVYLHWGVEGQACPSAEQRALAARLAEAGADAVVGTHAHLLLGAGWLGRTYVAYGLGNYLWWRDSAFSNDTGVLQLTFRGRRVVAAKLAPARIDPRGVPVPATGETAARIQRRWADLRGCTGLAGTP